MSNSIWHNRKYYSGKTDSNRTWIALFVVQMVALCNLWTDKSVEGRTTQNPRTQNPPVVQGSGADKGASSDSSLESRWEFGVEVGATGGADNVTVVFPIPHDWPEQTVKWADPVIVPAAQRVSEEKMDGVTLVTITWRSIAAGQTASIRVPAQIEKRFESAPTEVEKFKFSTRGNTKLKSFLQPSPYIESSHRRIKQLASELPLDNSRPAWHQVEQIYDWVRDNIEYRFDTKIKTCLDAIDDGYGDCEEMSSLFIALCRARGIPARAVWIPEHTYAEFYLEDDAGQGTWYPCQLAGTRQFGEMLEAKPVLQKGDKFKIPGNSQPLRYAQPTLVAERTQGQLTLKWIAQELNEPGR